jgi:hypothetical protein
MLLILRKLMLLVLLFSSATWADQTETFIFEFGSSNIIVTSAGTKQKTYNVIVKNRMLIPLKARLESLDLKTIIPISVPVGEDRPYKFTWKDKQSYRLLPLSPPFEEIFLEVGREVYEIPPKK